MFVFMAIKPLSLLNLAFSMFATTVDVVFRNIDDALASFPPKKCLRSMFDNLCVVFKANVKTSDIEFTKFVVRFTLFDIWCEATDAKFNDAALMLSKMWSFRGDGVLVGVSVGKL